MTGLKTTPPINSILDDVRFVCGAKSFDPQYFMWEALKECGIDLQPKQHRIFISGPMTGYVCHNYPLFEKVEDMLTIAGYKCVNPAKIGMKYDPEKVDKNKKLYKAMEKEIQEAEKTCNTILLLPGWENSVGVRIELQTAIRMKMKIVLGDHLI